MSHTAHKKQEDKKEYFDSENVLQQKINTIAELILKSKYFIAFTGAGISTSAGIPDFRSGANTVLPTGPGAWEKRAQKIKNKTAVDMNRAVPSFTHMSLVALQKKGYLKHLISQNTDGLHMKSGFNLRKLTELHGNRCIEICRQCNLKYVRDFRTREAKQTHNHKTSRKCYQCKNYLYDTILNFGEYYPQDQLEQAQTQGERADLCLAMGSSFYVKTAADIPKEVGKRGKLIIVNLQKTPLDKYAYIRVNCLCDEFMKKLSEKLELKIEQFLIRKLLKFTVNKEMETFIRGVDSRGLNYTILKEVQVFHEEKLIPIKAESDVYKIKIGEQKCQKIRLNFYDWLGEPPFELQVDGKEGILELVYDPMEKVWLKEEMNWKKALLKGKS